MNNEATAYPWWCIIDPPSGRIVGKRDHGLIAFALDGPFFSRGSAQDYLDSHRYNYSERAVVWCHSGHKSREWREHCFKLTGCKP